MSNPTDNYQQYQCPEWFQEELTRVGGTNRYDFPNFIVVGEWAVNLNVHTAQVVNGQ